MRNPENPAKEIPFDMLQGWLDLDHSAALACFRKSARAFNNGLPTKGELGALPEALAAIGATALQQPASLGHAEARKFFERHFRAFRFAPGKYDGFVTGYFEPEVRASRTKTETMRFPLHARPDDLVKVRPGGKIPGLPEGFEFARKDGDRLSEYHDRQAIYAGALDGRGLELFWFESPIDIFFIHIQGSARLALDDGSVARITYAGKTGHPYTPIGRILVERGELNREEVTMETIRKWLDDHPQRVMELLGQNRSYIFFAEVEPGNINLHDGPVAAAGVPLTAGYSLAVDKRLHTYGTPVFVRTNKPLPEEEKPFSRLMIAQDTGSAIVGHSRGDIFIGSGDEAGRVAGGVKHDADMVFLLPATSNQEQR